MPENSVVDQLASLFEDLFGDEAKTEDAAKFQENPAEVLNQAGLTEEALDGCGLTGSELVGQAAQQADISSDARRELQGFSSGGGRSSGGSSQTDIVNSVTFVTNEGPRDLRTFTTFDNSTDLEFDGEFDDIDLDLDQDLDVDQREVKAEAGGVAVLGDDNEVQAATGEDSVLVGEDNEGNIASGDGNAQVDGAGQANTGAGAVQVGDDLEDSNVITGEVGDGNVLADDIEDSLVNTGRVEEGAVLTGGDLNAPVVTGTVEGIVADELDNDGILAGGDIENKGGVLANGAVEDVVIGDGNQTAQVDGGGNDSLFNFGDGATAINQSDIDDAAIATGGDATNVSDNEDTALAFGGDAQNISNNDVRDGALAGDDASNLSNSDVELDDGSALAVGGDARGENKDESINDSFNEDNRQDNDTDIRTDIDTDIDDSFNREETDVDAENSNVGTEQGAGDLEQDELEVEVEQPAL